eukprot:SAG11_NODE_3465_length_2431_cov_1.608919_4_plen_184_part_01
MIIHNIPMQVLGEIFPLNVRSKAASLATAASWATSYAVTQSFRPLNRAIGNVGTFSFFGATSASFLVFVYTLLVSPTASLLCPLRVRFFDFYCVIQPGCFSYTQSLIILSSRSCEEACPCRIWFKAVAIIAAKTARGAQPETKGRPLESIHLLFKPAAATSGHERVVVWLNLRLISSVACLVLT